MNLLIFRSWNFNNRSFICLDSETKFFSFIVMNLNKVNCFCS